MRVFRQFDLSLPTTNRKRTSILLTADQLKNIFKEFDLNGDNVLSKQEIKKAFDYLGALFPGYRANCGISYADANGDGKVDMTELDDLAQYAYKLGYTIK